jgi:hypothetical protein
MQTLNITYQGESADYDVNVDVALSDDDIRRMAVEIINSNRGTVEGKYLRGQRPALPEDTFRNYVVDRFERSRIYLRPKVPFGG